MAKKIVLGVPRPLPSLDTVRVISWAWNGEAFNWKIVISADGGTEPYGEMVVSVTRGGFSAGEFQDTVTRLQEQEGVAIGVRIRPVPVSVPNAYDVVKAILEGGAGSMEERFLAAMLDPTVRMIPGALNPTVEDDV